MSDTIENTIETLKEMRLPELRARYAEVIGEESRCPNKTWLARKIAEAQVQADDEGAEPAIDDTEAADISPATEEATPTDAEQANDEKAANEEAADAQQDEGAAKSEGAKLSKLSIPELQQRYLEVVGRDTGSSAKNYLIWKIRQAEKGRIPVGPRRTRRTDGEAPDFKVLPLRMEADLVAQLDEARERLGLKSRMDLFRRSLHAFLLEAGEVRVAEMFAPEA
jgi:hypothetical protein